jgi:uncharacterized sporulation protein YeaH/YhbH (DUF444 family)
MEDKINSNESEGAFAEFIEERLSDMVVDVLNNGEISDFGQRGSEIVVEMDDIRPPTFSYGDGGDGQGQGVGEGPGGDAGKLSFSLPMEDFMQLVAKRLGLPNLHKEGQGHIKEVSYEFKTFGQAGLILDKKRTFKRALRTSVALGCYAPASQRHEVAIRRRDRRFKLPERVEKPRYKAVVFYMGDISYSTWGERLDLEKRIVSFIQHWLDYNYGASQVEHRFFVHDAEAYEVLPEAFYQVNNAGGTRAAGVFDLVAQIATNEYDPQQTNFYAFYFGDGELFEDDAEEIVEILCTEMHALFNRVGIVEVKPSSFSKLSKSVTKHCEHDETIKLAQLRERSSIADVIRVLFANTPARGSRNQH